MTPKQTALLFFQARKWLKKGTSSGVDKKKVEAGLEEALTSKWINNAPDIESITRYYLKNLRATRGTGM